LVQFVDLLRLVKGRSLTAAALLVPLVCSGADIKGQISDLNGQPLPQVMVTAERQDGATGADAVTVFSDGAGRFSMPVSAAAGGSAGLQARALGYAQVSVSPPAGDAGTDSPTFNIVMRRTANLADVAPASAWLNTMDGEARSRLIVGCISCHQVPSPEVRAYAAAIDAIGAPDPAAARLQSWAAAAKYMNLLWSEELARGRADVGMPDVAHAYSIGDVDGVAALLSGNFQGPMQTLSAYEYGAPLAVTAATTIREYEVPPPNAIREALLLGDPPRLWIADVSTDRIFSVDIHTGKRRVFDIPAKVDVGPHTLHPGPDRSLWVAPFFNGVVAHLNVETEGWRVWQLATREGTPAGIHDLSFGADHELLTDKQGRIWFSDIVNNAVGYFHPDSGEIDIYDAPEVEGRPGDQALLYGLAMTADRKYVWYSQLNIGVFGCFNVETLEYETVVVLPSRTAGPRRLTMGDDGVLYVPLYGAGQLITYDTRRRKQLGIYDLPDRGSAPYAVTWDPVRKVVWIPTSNGDVIYRFDPADASFGVIPLPRQRGFLRMIDVDPNTGVLVTSYANILEQVHGPRMALIIDPGDGAYQTAASR
jgi:streptogramin lyase